VSAGVGLEEDEALELANSELHAMRRDATPRASSALFAPFST
jgi:hypothetical protein